MARLLMRILTRDGVLDVEFPDADERSLLGRYWNEVRLFLEGRPSDLEQFEGARVAGHRLETDPDWIEAWGESGVLDFDEIYAIR